MRPLAADAYAGAGRASGVGAGAGAGNMRACSHLGVAARGPRLRRREGALQLRLCALDETGGCAPTREQPRGGEAHGWLQERQRQRQGAHARVCRRHRLAVVARSVQVRRAQGRLSKWPEGQSKEF